MYEYDDRCGIVSEFEKLEMLACAFSSVLDPFRPHPHHTPQFHARPLHAQRSARRVALILPAELCLRKVKDKGAYLVFRRLYQLDLFLCAWCCWLPWLLNRVRNGGKWSEGA